MPADSNKMTVVIRIANAFSIVFLILLVIVMSRAYVWPNFQTEAASEESGPRRLTTLVLPSAHKSVSAGKQLVIALQEGCSYCKRSAPLYRDLVESIKKAQGNKVSIAAIFPNGSLRAESYMKELGLPNTSIYYMDYAKLKITGTPTLFLTKNDGSVERQWSGLIQQEDERLVFDALRVLRIAAAPVSSESFSREYRSVDAEHVVAEMKSNVAITVVDVRERKDYALGHLVSAKNIPLQELAVRAAREIKPGAPVYVFYKNPSTSCKAPEPGPRALHDTGDVAAMILNNELGGADIRLVDADIDGLPDIVKRASANEKT